MHNIITKNVDRVYTVNITLVMVVIEWLMYLMA